MDDSGRGRVYFQDARVVKGFHTLTALFFLEVLDGERDSCAVYDGFSA